MLTFRWKKKIYIFFNDLFAVHTEACRHEHNDGQVFFYTVVASFLFSQMFFELFVNSRDFCRYLFINFVNNDFTINLFLGRFKQASTGCYGSH